MEQNFENNIKDFLDAYTPLVFIWSFTILLKSISCVTRSYLLLRCAHSREPCNIHQCNTFRPSLSWSFLSRYFEYNQAFDLVNTDNFRVK